jgi:zinc transport system ATP-binding protein
VADNLAIYTHHHDHDHDIHGNVIKPGDEKHG